MNYFKSLIGFLVRMFFSINALGEFNSRAYSLYFFTRSGVIQAHLPNTIKPKSSVERKMLQTDVEVNYQDAYESQFSHILKALADVDIIRLKKSHTKKLFYVFDCSKWGRLLFYNFFKIRVSGSFSKL